MLKDHANSNITPIKPLGRREKNKLDKLIRIKLAARELFLEKGYDDATLREIASRAEIAFGTLFLYAEDKSELLLLLFEEDVNALADDAFKDIPRNLPFVDQLITIFRKYFEFFLQNPPLSRFMMREATFYGPAGVVRERLISGQRRAEGRLAQIIATSQTDGKIAQHLSADRVGQLIFNIYRSEIRFCLSDKVPSIEHGLENLRADFEIIMSGLRPV